MPGIDHLLQRRPWLARGLSVDERQQSGLLKDGRGVRGRDGVLDEERHNLAGCALIHRRTRDMTGAQSVPPISHKPWHRYGRGGPVGLGETARAVRRALSTAVGPNCRWASASAAAWEPGAVAMRFGRCVGWPYQESRSSTRIPASSWPMSPVGCSGMNQPGSSAADIALWVAGKATSL